MVFGNKESKGKLEQEIADKNMSLQKILDEEKRIADEKQREQNEKNRVQREKDQAEQQFHLSEKPLVRLLHLIEFCSLHPGLIVINSNGTIKKYTYAELLTLYNLSDFDLSAL
jgi:hypothetical protein